MKENYKIDFYSADTGKNFTFSHCNYSRLLPILGVSLRLRNKKTDVSELLLTDEIVGTRKFSFLYEKNFVSSTTQ